MNSGEPNLRRLFGSEGTMGLFVALYLILLAFFILLNAVSEQAANRAVAAMESVNVTFKESRQIDNTPTVDPSAEDTAARDEVLSQVRRAFVAEMELEGRFATKGGNTFEVQFPAEYLFQRGSLRVRPDMTPFLDQLIAAVQATPNGKQQQVAILFGSGTGTVDREMTRPQEIAVRRAGAIARYLRRKGISDGVFTTGFAAIPEGQIMAAFWSAPANTSGASIMSAPISDGAKFEPIQAQGGWMITFADLLSLLLTFFVLMFSMSTVQFESWKAVVDTMTDEFNETRPKVELEPLDTQNRLKPSAGAGLNLNYLRVLLERAVSGHAAFEGVTVGRQGDQVVISIPANLLFERKDSQLVTGAQRPLQELAQTLAQIKNKVRVSGHTDSVPIRTGKYRSNWELSMARARVVAGILTDFGYRQPITVLGYADTQSRANSAGIVNAQNLAKAERVDIVLVTERRQEGLYDLF